MSFSLISTVILAIIIIIPVMIGVYVYRDASRRGMNAALWTLVAVLAPVLVGFIVYLLVRGGYSDMECPNCGSRVMEQYTVCPMCGVKLKASCSNCGFPIETGWTVCPKCASPLPAYNEGYMTPVRKTDTALGKILVLVIVIPIALLLLLGVLSFSIFRGAYSVSTVPMQAQSIEISNAVAEATSAPATMVPPSAAPFMTSSIGTSRLTKEDYAEQPKTIAWINQCDGDPSKTYALRYQSDNGARKVTYYLIYRPLKNRNDSVSISAGASGATVEANFFASPDGAAEEKLTCVQYSSDQYAGLQVFVDGIEIDCPVTEVDYNPTNMR